MRQLSDETAGRRVAAQFVPLRGSLRDVDPTITAAWISGGVGAVGIVGTAVTALIGSRSTRKATEQAIAAGAANTRATLTAAREDRVWEKRAAAYEETLAAVLFRRKQRAYELLDELWGDDARGLRVPNPFEELEPPGSLERRSRLWAYASDTVLAAAEVAEDAHIQVWLRHFDEVRIRRKQEAHPALDEAEAVHQAVRRFGDAVDGAAAADESLIKVIRDEMRSKPEAAMLPVLPAEVLAKRRRLPRHPV